MGGPPGAPDAALAYRTLSTLSLEARVAAEVIRRDLRLGRVHADRPGTEYLFNPAQWDDACRYYRRRARRTTRADRTSDG